MQKKIDKAIGTLRKEKIVIKYLVQNHHSDAVEPLSIVFPEVIRYNMLKNFVETSANESLYVYYGKDKSDFSIGYFQMKPSFIEKLEEYVLKYPKVANEYKWICEYSSKEIIGIRRERINRLSNFKWQIFYALVFHAICGEVFKNENFNTNNDRLRFYATAYNSGFDKEPDVLRKWMDRETFPYGPKSALEQYCYSKLSLEFYEKYSVEFK